jgi:hypothetical protein
MYGWGRTTIMASRAIHAPRLGNVGIAGLEAVEAELNGL